MQALDDENLTNLGWFNRKKDHKEKDGKRRVPRNMWAEKAKKLMKNNSKYYRQVNSVPEVERKEEYLELVRKHPGNLRSMKAPSGMKKEIKWEGHHIIRKPHPKKIIIGLEGSSVECIE